MEGRMPASKGVQDAAPAAEGAEGGEYEHDADVRDGFGEPHTSDVRGGFRAADVREQRPYRSGHDQLLYAALEQEDIYLFGCYSDTSHWMALYQGGCWTRFDWQCLVGPRMLYPEMLCRDLDGDGGKEIAVAVPVGSGTGVSLRDLHILSAAEGGARKYDEYALLAGDVREWMAEPFEVSLDEENEALIFDFCGDSYIVGRCDEAEGGRFAGVVFGDAVGFDMEETGIEATIAIGAMYERHMVVRYFGSIVARVEFDGEGVRLVDYAFAPLSAAGGG
jgi:hypothetical protein